MLLPLNRADLLSKVELLQLLQPTTTQAEVAQCCALALTNRLSAVWVNGSHLTTAYALLEESPVKTVCTIGFPFGAMDADAKRYEAEVAIDNGAHELAVVLNHGWLKENKQNFLLRELRDIIEVAEERPVTGILELSLLTPDDQLLSCQLAGEAGLQFVATATGSISKDTRLEIVDFLRTNLESKVQIKVFGRNFTADTAQTFVNAGASRLCIAEATALLADSESN